MKTNIDYELVDAVAHRLHDLKSKRTVKNKDILLRPLEVVRASENGDKSLWNYWIDLRYSMLESRLKASREDDLKSIEAGDIYLIADRDDIDKTAIDRVYKVYSEVYDV